MLKMTIDNEEVVSDKDITINEEMLSASSSILNNVYPKEWEEDKDYTSRFYYPQDYSKALIQRSYVTQEAEAGTTIQVNGSATLTDVDTTKNSRVLRLLGQTSQTGTPTPSSPIPVNVVSGDNEIIIKGNGKNLFNKDFHIINGSFINGSGGISSDSTLSYQDYFIEVEQNTEYTISSSVSTIYRIAKYNSSKTFINRPYNENPSRSYTINTGNAKYIKMAGTLTSALDSLQIEKSSTTSNYEPYIGNTYNIDLPVENLFNKSGTPISNASTTMSELDTGVRATVTSAGNNRYSAYKLSNSDSLLGKTLNISATITVSGTNNAYIRFYWLNGNTLTSLIAQTINSTGNANFNVPNSYPSGSNGIAILFSSNVSGSSSIGDYVDYTNVMLTYDNYKGKYTPYGTTPIELCKIGNYQDYIYKDSDKWYLHKEIGKYNIDTSTLGIKTNYTNIEYATIPKPNDYLGYGSFDKVEIICKSASHIAQAPSGWNDANLVNKISGNPEANRWWLGFSKGTGITAIQNALNGSYIYYPLTTPTNTEITYQPLIEQLNALSSQ